MFQRLFAISFVLAVAASAATAGQVPSSSPLLAADDDAQAVAHEFAERFGEPSSPTFAALDASTRLAVERYFVRGRGTVPREGVVDFATTGAGTGAGGAQSGVPKAWYADPVPGYPGLFNIALTNTGSGFLEMFLLQVPDTAPSAATPALVVFHKFGVSHADALFNTTFVAECRARGWYMLAPIGATDDNFGGSAAQINTAAVLAWARSTVPIDPMRIYGVGFSMGGGWCASYAARHLDPASSTFAAIMDHTGTVSLGDAYANESPSVQLILEGLFGGSPAAQPFEYQRYSTIDIDHLTLEVGVGTDMARNLAYVHSWVADHDPQPYLPTETAIFATHMQAMNPADILTVAPGNVHSWSTLDDHATCDWLASYALQEPLSGTTLADANGAWHRFTVEQDAPGSFTPFSWMFDPVANRLSFWQTANLRSIRVSPNGLGIVYSGTLKLNLSSADGTGDEVIFSHVPAAPTSILRNGVPATAPYDPVAQTLVIDEPSGAGSQWVIHF
jgi:dienelactone hydrolase